MPDTPMPDMPEQPVQQPGLTLDEILAFGLNDLLEQDPLANYYDMYGMLAKGVSDVEAAGDVVKSRALWFMTGTASMMLTRPKKSRHSRRWPGGPTVPVRLCQRI